MSWSPLPDRRADDQSQLLPQSCLERFVYRLGAVAHGIGETHQAAPMHHHYRGVVGRAKAP